MDFHVAAPRASFMGLPPEIRILIYRYLVPDVSVVAGRVRPLRRDNEQCSPNILRVSRRIYQEAIAVWYGSTLYHIAIMYPYKIQYLRYDIGISIHQLPSTFAAIRLLRTRYTLHMIPPETALNTQSEAPKSDHMLELMVDALFLKLPSLQDLRLTAVISLPFFSSAKKQLCLLRKALEWNLSPFLKFHQLSSIDPNFDSLKRSTYWRANHEDDAMFRETETRIVAELKDYCCSTIMPAASV